MRDATDERTHNAPRTILSRGMKSRQWELTVRNSVRTMLLEEFNSTPTRTWVTSAQGMSCRSKECTAYRANNAYRALRTFYTSLSTFAFHHPIKSHHHRNILNICKCAKIANFSIAWSSGDLITVAHSSLGHTNNN